MQEKELNSLTIGRAARLIRTRKISPVELTQAYLDRIERLDPTLKAFIIVTADLAQNQAQQAEQEIMRGSYRGVLHGIPFALKDLFYTKGIRTTGGSRILRDFVPSYNGTATQRLYEAGAVLLGKANLHEFGTGITSDNPHYGRCQNPWKVGYIPGGSSGGSASAVGASLCLASLGTDTGGSIRIPASFCGIVGHKPTYGLVSRHGIVALSWSLDHAGPMTRTVADAAHVLQAIAGHDPRDPCSARMRVPNFARALRSDLRGVRIGVPVNHYFEFIHPEVYKAVRKAINQLKELGGYITEVQIPEVDAALDASFVIGWAEAAHFHHEWLRTRPTEYGQDVRESLEAASLYLAADYLHAQQVRALIRRAIRRVFQQVDVLVYPSTPIPATPHGHTETILMGQRVPVLDIGARLNTIANLTGEPACSVPCGFTEDGLPVGLMVHGPAFQDSLVLRVAHAYEEASGWTKSSPNLEGSGRFAERCSAKSQIEGRCIAIKASVKALGCSYPSRPAQDPPLLADRTG